MPAATALLALWNDVTPDQDAQYNQWHALEHVPERLTVPGFLWALRYGSPPARRSPRYLTLYGLRDAQVLDGQAYIRLLREPTPMSRAMRPHLHNVSRWVCALHTDTSLSTTAPQLAVWTWQDVRADHWRTRQTSANTTGVMACMLAQRIPAAAALPWLSATQQANAAAVDDGNCLRCIGFDATDPPTAAILAGSRIFDQLPMG